MLKKLLSNKTHPIKGGQDFVEILPSASSRVYPSPEDRSATDSSKEVVEPVVTDSGDSGVLSVQALQQAHLRFLARPLLQEVLEWQAHCYGADQTQSKPTPSCFVCYAWPASIRASQQDPHARVLQLMEDLQRAGIAPYIDIDHLTKEAQDQGRPFYTEIEAFINKGIAHSAYTLVLASPSYHERVCDASTSTHKMVTALKAKTTKERHKDSVIPLLWSGEIFPTDFSTMGGKLTTVAEYLMDLPGITATLLGIEKNERWQQCASEYQDKLRSLIEESMVLQWDEALVQQTQARYEREQSQLERRLQSRLAQLPLAIRRELDGALSERIALLNKRLLALSQPFPINQTNSDITQALQPLYQAIQQHASQENDISVTLNSFSANWQEASPKVLVVDGPVDAKENCGKRDWLRYQEQRAWTAWIAQSQIVEGVTQEKQEKSAQEDSTAPLPIYVNLKHCHQPKGRLLLETLSRWGLHQAEIDLVQQAIPVLVLVDGLAPSELDTNYYTRNALSTWQAKMIIRYASTISNPVLDYYFAPSDDKKNIWRDGLQYLTVPNRRPSLSLDLGQLTQSLAHLSLDLAKARQDSKLNAMKEVAAQHNVNQTDKHQALAQKLNVKDGATNTPEISEKDKHYQAYLFCQKQRHERELYPLLAYFANVASEARSPTCSAENATQTRDSLGKVFISYAWPSGDDLTQLQVRLQQIVQDLQEARLETLLDIEQIKVGTHLQDYMQQGIKESRAILWIGSPILKQKLTNQQSNAAFEYQQLWQRHKTAQSKNTASPVYCIGMQGKPDQRFPDVANVLPASHHHDFSREQDYYLRLPRLVFHLLHLESHTECCDRLQAYELAYHNSNDFSETDLQAAMQQAEKKRQDDEAKAKAVYQAAVENIKAEDEALLQRLEQATDERLLVAIQQLKEQCDALLPESFFGKELKKYVPLNGTKSAVSEPDQEDIVDLLTLIRESIQPNTAVLLQGASGGGKSLFLRRFSQICWETYDQASAEDKVNFKPRIPLVINLPQMGDIGHDLIERALTQAGWSEEVIEDAKAKKLSWMLIFDGLDEVALTYLNKATSFLHAARHQLANEWDIAWVIGCRREQVPVLEIHLGRSLLDYLKGQAAAQQTIPVNTLYVVPFNLEQIHQFIEQFVTTPDAPWKQVSAYTDKLKSLAGLDALMTTPFILNLVCQALPLLSADDPDADYKTQQISKAQVYQAFFTQWFSKEAWRQISLSDVSVSDNVMATWAQACQDWGVRMLQQDTVQLPQTDAMEAFSQREQTLLLKACPVKLLGNPLSLSFIHKSVMEFSAASFLHRALRMDIAMTIHYWQGLDLLKQESVMHFLSELCRYRDEDRLWELVYASRYDDTLAPISAVAITLLNMRGVSFSRKDLSHIKIPHADLSLSVCQQTNFSDSDLTGVNLANSYLMGTDFTRTQLNNAFIDIERGTFLPHSNITRYERVPNQRTLLLWGKDHDGEFVIFQQMDDKATPSSSNTVRCTKCDTATFSSDGGVLVLTGIIAPATVVCDGQTGAERHRIVMKEINQVTFSPDGSMLVLTGKNAPKAVVCDGQTGAEQGRYPDINKVTFSPDGHLLVLTGEFGSMVCDARTGAERGRYAEMRDVTFSPDGSLLVLTGYDAYKAVVCDGQTGAERHQIAAMEHIYIVTFSPDGSMLVLTGAEESAAVVCDGQTGEKRYWIDAMERIYQVTFSPDGSLLVLTGGIAPKTVVCDGRTGAERGRYPDINKVTFSPDGGVLVLTGYDASKAVVCDGQTGEERYRIAMEQIHKVTFSPEGNVLLLSGRQASVLYSVSNHAVLKRFSGEMALYSFKDKCLVCYDPAGVISTTIFITAESKLVECDQRCRAVLQDGERLLLLTHHELFEWCLDEQTLQLIMLLHGALIDATVECFDGIAKLCMLSRLGFMVYDNWQFEAEERHSQLISRFGHELPVTKQAVLNDVEGISVSANENELMSWQDSKGRLQLVSPIVLFRDGRTLDKPKKSKSSLRVYLSKDQVILVTPCGFSSMIGERDIKKATFSPDGSLLVLTGGERYVETDHKYASKAVVCDGQTGVERHRIAVKEIVNATFSPDGGLLVLTGKYASEAVVCDGRTGAERGRYAEMRYVTFSPDGSVLVLTGGRYVGAPLHTYASKAVVCDGQTGEERGHYPDIKEATFSPDGSVLVLTGDRYVPTLGRTYASEAVVCDGQTGAERHQITVENINNATFSRDGRLLVLTGERASTAVVCDGQTGVERHRIAVKEIVNATFSPDGGLLVLTGKIAPAAVVCDGKTGAERHRIVVKMLDKATFSPDGGLLVLTGWNAPKAVVCDGQTGAERGHYPDIKKATFSPGGSLLVLTGKIAPAAVVCDGKTGEERGRYPKIKKATFSPDGSLLVLTGVEAPAAVVCDGQTGAERYQIAVNKINMVVGELTFSPDGNLLLLTSKNTGKAVIIYCSGLASGDFTGLAEWEPAHGINQRGFEQHPIYGHYVVLCGESIRVYLIGQTRLLVFPFEATDVTFYGQVQGTQLPATMITSHQDGTLRLWDISDLEQIVLLSCTKGLKLVTEQVRYEHALGLSDNNRKVLSKNRLNLPTTSQKLACYTAIAQARVEALCDIKERKMVDHDLLLSRSHGQCFFGDQDKQVPGAVVEKSASTVKGSMNIL